MPRKLQALSRKDFLLLSLAGGATTALAMTGCASGNSSAGNNASANGAGNAANNASGNTGGSSSQTAAYQPLYQGKLFDTTRVHMVDIVMSKDDWSDLQAHPLDKKKYAATIEIDGELFDDVTVSVKGSNSLRSMVKDGTGRYSLKVKFGKNDSSQSYCGLEEINLGNNATDASMLKDYLAYKLFRKQGVPAALASFAWVTVNGEPYGLYIVTENIGAGFLARNYGGQGKLYKPEAADLAALNKAQDAWLLEAQQTGAEPRSISIDDILSLEVYNAAGLLYLGDDPASYGDIFDNAQTKASDKDKARVIAAIKALSEGNVEQAVEIDQVIRYFAVHNLTANFDSYLGILDHNYYLYERRGKLQMLPWDYDFYDVMYTNEDASRNLASGKQHEDAAIDKPLAVPEDSRPMWSWIPASEHHMAAYHKAVASVLDDAVDSGWIAGELDRVHDLIRPYVQKDPSALYSVDEFDGAVDAVKRFWAARSENVRKQLKG